jgi:rhodanese-related sulfurtransferase
MENLDAAQFAEKISDQNVVIVDVRTATEFAEGHIPNAINVDVLSDYFTADISALDKSLEYAIYCRSGKRSVDAAIAMDEIGFSTSNLTGGIISWAQANKEITC